MPDRYFVPQPIHGDGVTLVGSEAHHLAHVMRAKPGDRVILFDGTGGEFAGTIIQVRRDRVELSVGPRQEVDREARRRVTLGVALPKGDRQRWLVEKAVELGVARLVPLETARGVVQPGSAAIVRLERAVIEATKQCGRNRLMEIARPLAWQGYVVSAPSSARRLVAHPSESAVALTDVSRTDDAELFLAIGPEGGLTDEEVAHAVAQGWESVDLGPRILRIETAAVALAAYWLLEPRG